MSNVLFVVPSVKNIYKNPPVGTLLLTSILKNEGIFAEVFPLAMLYEHDDFNAYIDNMVNEIVDKKAKIVSFYTRCDVYHIMLRIAQELKARCDAVVVFGGPHSDIVAKETIEAFPCVDYICQGEGETTIVPFFSSLLQGEPDLSVAGLVYRRDGCTYQNPRPKLVCDLDSLPEIDYSVIGMNKDNAINYQFPVDVGRGCPFGCSYCSTSVFWGRKYRLKSPERVYEEMKTLHKKYGISKFAFMHDMFTFNRNQIMETCKLIKEANPQFVWSCSARIDCIDDDLIDTMFDAGMRSIYFGIESGSERIQKLIHKNLKLDTVLPKIQYVHSKGVGTTVSFIYGFPEETLEDLSKTLYMISEIAKLDKVSIQAHLCAFLPGTELAQKHFHEMVPAQYFSDISGSVGVKECEEMVFSHPEVFPQFLEYETELRKKTEYFSVFVEMWTLLQPIYQFISEQYEKDRLIDMYLDFLQCNQEALGEYSKLPKREGLHYLIEHDRLPQKFIPEELKETVSECYRIAAAQYSPVLRKEGSMIEMFSISPNDFKRGSSITDYQKRTSVGKYEMQEDGKVNTYICDLG